MKRHSRRQFLKMTALSALIMAGGPVAERLLRAGQVQAAPLNVSGGAREYLLLCNTEIAPPAPRKYAPRPGTLNAMDIGSGEVFSVPVPFFGHIAIQNPAQPEQVVLFEQWGTRSALIDIKDRKLLNVASTDYGKTFLGHAVFTEDGSLLVDTEENKAQTQGFLVLRDTTHMNVVETITSYGVAPHECRSLDQGKTLMVANAGHGHETPNVSWVDVKSGKLLHQVEIPASDVLYAHLNISHDGWMCVVGTNSVYSKKKSFDLVTFISPDGKVLPPKLPEPVAAKLRNEALSIAFLGNSGLVAVTLPSDNLLLIFDYKTQMLVQAMGLPAPNGILYDTHKPDDEADMIVSLSGTRKMVEIVGKKNTPTVIESIETEFGGNGLHLSRVYA